MIWLLVDSEIRSAKEVAERLGSMRGVMAKLGQMASYVEFGLSDDPLMGASGIDNHQIRARDVLCSLQS